MRSSETMLARGFKSVARASRLPLKPAARTTQHSRLSPPPILPPTGLIDRVPQL